MLCCGMQQKLASIVTLLAGSVLHYSILLSNYKDFVTQMKELVNKAISKIDDPDIEKDFEGILETPITSEDTIKMDLLSLTENNGNTI